MNPLNHPCKQIFHLRSFRGDETWRVWLSQTASEINFGEKAAWVGFSLKARNWARRAPATCCHRFLIGRLKVNPKHINSRFRLSHESLQVLVWCFIATMRRGKSSNAIHFAHCCLHLESIIEDWGMQTKWNSRWNGNTFQLHHDTFYRKFTAFNYFQLKNNIELMIIAHARSES